jgi:hypothetical protein
MARKYWSSRWRFDILLLFPIVCLYMSVWVCECENVSLVCRGLALYRFLFAPLYRCVVSVNIFRTRYYDTLCCAYAFMTHYIMHGYSWRVMSRMGIYSALFQGWAVMADKRNSGLAEAPEFDLWVYSIPLGGVE